MSTHVSKLKIAAGRVEVKATSIPRVMQQIKWFSFNPLLKQIYVLFKHCHSQLERIFFFQVENTAFSSFLNITVAFARKGH